MTIRKLSDEVKQGLRLRAAEHGHSMEEEARQILAAAVSPATEDAPKPKNFLLALREMVERDGCYAELELPSRASHRQPPDFS